MTDAFSEQLLASYADVGEAMAVQAFLEAQGIRARAQDLERLPLYAVGSIFGNLGRSAGVWVLASDLERARELLAIFEAPENAVDEASLEAEALAAGHAPAVEAPAAVPQPRARPRAGGSEAARLALTVLGIAVAIAALVAVCSGR